MLSKLDRLANPSMSARFNIIFIYYGIFKDVCQDWSVPVHDHSLVTRTNKLYIGSYRSPFYRIPNKPKNMSISGRHRVKIRVGRYVCFKKFVRIITSPRIISIYCSTLYMVWFIVLGRWWMSIPYFMKGRFNLQTPKVGCFLQWNLTNPCIFYK